MSGRSPAGQAATALYKLSEIGRELDGKDLAVRACDGLVEKPDDGLAQSCAARQRRRSRRGQLDVVIENLDVQKAKPLINDEFDIPSEVDEFWKKLRSEVMPAVKKNQQVIVEARLERAAGGARKIAQDAKAELVKAGAAEAETTVTVLSAYKQGYSWLYDVVRPALAGKPVDSHHDPFAEIGPPTAWKQQGMFAPTRWLLELYPIDEILARELKIDLKKIRFEKMPIGSPAYEVIVTSGGAEILRHTFEPKYVLALLLRSCFPITSTCASRPAGSRPRSAGKQVVDERIATDPERFWDHFQTKTLPALYDHVMALAKGKPRAEDAPFFGELTVDLTLSEPNYRLRSTRSRSCRWRRCTKRSTSTRCTSST